MVPPARVMPSGLTPLVFALYAATEGARAARVAGIAQHAHGHTPAVGGGGLVDEVLAAGGVPGDHAAGGQDALASGQGDTALGVPGHGQEQLRDRLGVELIAPGLA